MPVMPPAYPRWPFIGVAAGFFAITYGLLATIYWEATFLVLLGTVVTGAIIAGASLIFLISLYQLRN